LTITFSYASRKEGGDKELGWNCIEGLEDVVEFGAGDHNFTEIIAKLEEVKAGTSRIGTEGI